MNPIASAVSALLALVLALVLCLWAVVAVGVLVGARWVFGVVGAVIDGVRDRIPQQR